MVEADAFYSSPILNKFTYIPRIFLSIIFLENNLSLIGCTFKRNVLISKEGFKYNCILNIKMDNVFRYWNKKYRSLKMRYRLQIGLN